jgi:hypothetical protein
VSTAEDMPHWELIASMKVVREKGVTMEPLDLLESLFDFRVRSFFGI